MVLLLWWNYRRRRWSWNMVRLVLTRDCSAFKLHVLELGELVAAVCGGDSFSHFLPESNGTLECDDVWLPSLAIAPCGIGPGLHSHLCSGLKVLHFAASMSSWCFFFWSFLVFFRYLETSFCLTLAGWSKLSIIGKLFLRRRPISRCVGGSSMPGSGVVRSLFFRHIFLTVWMTLSRSPLAFVYAWNLALSQILEIRCFWIEGHCLRPLLLGSHRLQIASSALLLQHCFSKTPSW